MNLSPTYYCTYYKYDSSPSYATTEFQGREWGLSLPLGILEKVGIYQGYAFKLATNPNQDPNASDFEKVHGRNHEGN